MSQPKEDVVMTEGSLSLLAAYSCTTATPNPAPIFCISDITWMSIVTMSIITKSGAKDESDVVLASPL